MGLRDYRRLVEVGAPDEDGLQPFAAVELTDHDRRPIRLELSFEGIGIAVALNEGEAGQLLDYLAGALRVLAAGDTPTGSQALSEGSARLPDRGGMA